SVYSSFFFDATSSTATYTLSLHDALPICSSSFFIYAGPLRPAFLSQLKSDGFIKVSLPCHINDAKGLHNAPRYTFLPGLLTLFSGAGACSRFIFRKKIHSEFKPFVLPCRLTTQIR